MSGTSNKKSLRERIWEKRLYIAVFAIPFLIMYIVYAIFGVHPYGDESVLTLDLNGQYVYYYEAFRDAFYGDGSFIYNWGRNLSGEMFGIFAYYLASPFMLILVILPRSMMCGAVELMELCKVGASAVTFAVFLRQTRNPKTSSVIIFSVLYSLMAYSVVELMNPMWIDGLVYLPLIILGVEKLVNKGKMLPLIIPLGLMFIAHFYIGYMIGIFTAIYFVYYCFTREGRVVCKGFFEACAKFFLSAVIAVMCSAVVIIPVYNSLKLGKFDFTVPDFSLKTQFDFMEFITKLLPFSYDTVRPEGLPMIFCGTITLLLIPLFFMNSKISGKEKGGTAIITAVVYILMYVKPLDMAMHGFQVPNWLPYRYSFTFSFLMILMAFRAFENLDGVTTKELGTSFFGWLVVVLYLEHEQYNNFEIIGGVWVSIVCLVGFFILLNLLKKYKTRAMAIIVTVFVCIETCALSLNLIYAVDEDVNFSKFSSYQDYMADGRDVVDYIEEGDSGLYRMEKTFARTVNDPIGWGFAGISHSSSTMNAPVLTMLKELGYGYGGHSTRYQNATMLSDALFGIKYLMHKEDTSRNSPLYKEYPLVYTPEDTGIADIMVYENPYALPIGFAGNEAVLDFYLDSDNPFMDQSNLMNTLIYGTNTDEWQDFFRSAYFTNYIPENISVASASGNYTKYSPITQGLNTQLEYIFNIQSEEPLYMFLYSDYQRQLNVWVNKVFNGFFFEGENYCIMNLGEHSIGEEMSLILTLTRDDLYIRDDGVWFYHMQTDELAKATEKLKAGSWNLTTHTDTYLEGDITVAENQLLFTTIPYEEGWKITVDGVEVEPVKTLNSLIAVELTEGTHTVAMRFFPNYLTMGIVISAIGVLLVVFVGILQWHNGELVYRLMIKSKKKASPQKPELQIEEASAIEIEEITSVIPQEPQDEEKQ